MHTWQRIYLNSAIINIIGKEQRRVFFLNMRGGGRKCTAVIQRNTEQQVEDITCRFRCRRLGQIAL